MQFYLNGYQPGDPLIEDPDPSVAQRPEGLPEEVDVLIIGCGPAGLVLAAQLASFPGITRWSSTAGTVRSRWARPTGSPAAPWRSSRRSGWPTGWSREAYWVNEVCFWRPDPEDRSRITRTGRVQDTEDGLSEFPHVIVNQARMLAYLREHMERSPSRLVPYYGLHATDVEVDTSGASEYPVTVTLQHVQGRRRPGRPRRSGRSTSSAATARAAASGPRSAGSWPATRRTSPGVSWTSWRSPTSPTSASSARSTRPIRATC